MQLFCQSESTTSPVRAINSVGKFRKLKSASGLSKNNFLYSHWKFLDFTVSFECFSGESVSTCSSVLVYQTLVVQ